MKGLWAPRHGGAEAQKNCNVDVSIEISEMEIPPQPMSLPTLRVKKAMLIGSCE